MELSAETPDSNAGRSAKEKRARQTEESKVTGSDKGQTYGSPQYAQEA